MELFLLSSLQKHYVYILYSLKDNRLYKGYSQNLATRYLKHNGGGVVSTKHRRPLILAYLESYTSKSEALRMERYYKSSIGGPQLITRLQGIGILDQDKKLVIVI